MGDIGEDIKEALNEVGRDFTIERTTEFGGVISGEFLLLEKDYYASISNLRLIAYMFYDTVAQSGDLIKMDNFRFIVSSIKPNEEEHEIYLNEVELFECNVIGSVQRHTTSTPYYDPQTYRTSPNFQSVYTGVYGSLIENINAGTLKEAQIYILSEGQKLLFLPKYYTINENDRFVTASKTYNIIGAEDRINTDMVLCHIEEDVRTS